MINTEISADQGRTIFKPDNFPDGQKFGSFEWALSKIQRGYIRGAAPGLSDCHIRTGYSLRLLHSVLHSKGRAELEKSFLVILATPGGQIAHSMVMRSGKIMASKKDRQVLKALPSYQVLYKWPLLELIDQLESQPDRIRPDPLDHVSARLLPLIRDVEDIFQLTEEVTRGLAKALEQGPNGTLGFSTSSKIEKIVLESLIEIGAAEVLYYEGEMARTRLTDLGHGFVEKRIERPNLLDASRSKPAPRKDESLHVDLANLTKNIR